jgi:hypothetical protein
LGSFQRLDLCQRFWDAARVAGKWFDLCYI